MSFNQAFVELYCNRFSDNKDIEPLTTSEQYKRKRETLETKINEAGDTGDIWQAVLEYCDIVSQFYYRAGIKDGAGMTCGRDFLIPT